MSVFDFSNLIHFFICWRWFIVSFLDCHFFVFQLEYLLFFVFLKIQINSNSKGKKKEKYKLYFWIFREIYSVQVVVISAFIIVIISFHISFQFLTLQSNLILRVMDCLFLNSSYIIVVCFQFEYLLFVFCFKLFLKDLLK